MATIRDDFLATARLVGELLRDPGVAAAWEAPSALPEFSVRGLAGHLLFQVQLVRDVLDAPPTSEEAIPLLEHYGRVTWIGAGVDDEFNTRIRHGGEALAGHGPQHLAAEYDSTLGAVAADLPAVLDRPVHLPLWGPWALSLDDLIVSRTMELTVHCDDLAVSVGVPTPVLPQSGVERVVDLLSRIALRRHGQTAVLRALSRAERAPATIAAI
jgi:Mycothiol maleylpyruvate isomerase N-terminal domain